MGRTWTVNGTDETSVLPVKAPRDALTGKAAFQAAGYRRRGSRRSERGAAGVESAANRSGASRRQRPRRKRAEKSHAWSYMCPTRGAICVPRVGQAWFHAWDRSSPSGETDRQSRGMRAFAVSLNANCRLSASKRQLTPSCCPWAPVWRCHPGRLRHLRRKVSSM